MKSFKVTHTDPCCPHTDPRQFISTMSSELVSTATIEVRTQSTWRFSMANHHSPPHLASSWRDDLLTRAGHTHTPSSASTGGVLNQLQSVLFYLFKCNMLKWRDSSALFMLYHAYPKLFKSLTQYSCTSDIMAHLSPTRQAQPILQPCTQVLPAMIQRMSAVRISWWE